MPTQACKLVGRHGMLHMAVWTLGPSKYQLPFDLHFHALCITNPAYIRKNRIARPTRGKAIVIALAS